MKKILLLLLLLSCSTLFACKLKLKEVTPEDGFFTNQLTHKEMEVDLDYYVKTMEENHVNLYHSISKEDFMTEVELIRSNLPNFSSEEFVFQMMKLCALINDSASRIYFDTAREVNQMIIPIEFNYFDDGMYVYKIEKENEKYLGWRLEEISGIPIDVVIERLKSYFGSDTQIGLESTIINNLTSWDLLYSAEIVVSQNVKFTFSKGEETSEVFINSIKNSEYDSESLSFDTLTGQTLSVSKEYYKNYLFGTTLYIQYNYSGDTVKTTTQKFNSEIKSRIAISKPTSIILDFRYNYGGNFSLFTPILETLREFKKEGKPVYLFVGRDSSSVSLVNALSMNMENLVTTVGQISKNSVNYYSGVTSYLLPNSRLKFSFPTTFKVTVQGAFTSFHPQYTVFTTYEDWKNGIDRTLQNILDGVIK